MGSGFGPLEAELMNELNERSEILMAENAVMLEQKTVLISELDSYQSELSKRNQDIAQLTQQLNTISKDFQSTQNAFVQAEKDRDEGSRQILRCIFIHYTNYIRIYNS